MTDLRAHYETRMRELVRKRRARIDEAREQIDAANDEIDAANREFDKGAIVIQRELDKLTPEEAPKPKSTPKPRTQHDPSWSQEDIDHFYELQEQNQ